MNPIFLIYIIYISFECEQKLCIVPKTKRCDQNQTHQIEIDFREEWPNTLIVWQMLTNQFGAKWPQECHTLKYSFNVDAKSKSINSISLSKWFFKYSNETWKVKVWLWVTEHPSQTFGTMVFLIRKNALSHISPFSSAERQIIRKRIYIWLGHEFRSIDYRAIVANQFNQIGDLVHAIEKLCYETWLSFHLGDISLLNWLNWI